MLENGNLVIVKAPTTYFLGKKELIPIGTICRVVLSLYEYNSVIIVPVNASDDTGYWYLESEIELLNYNNDNKSKFANTSFISYKLRSKQWEMEIKIKEELKKYSRLEFLNMYTRKTLREVMIALFPYETMMNESNRAFISMTKVRMYNHLLGYSILKGWHINKTISI